MAKRSLNIPVTADTSGLKKGLTEADKALGKAEGSVANLTTAIKQLQKEKAEARVDVDVAKADAKIRLLKKELRSVTDAEARSDLEAKGLFKPLEKQLDNIADKARDTGAELESSIGGAGGRVGGKFKAGMAGLAGIAAGVGVVAGAAFTKGLGEQMEKEDLSAKLKVQLGLTEKESARYGKIAGKLYASNYGESLSEVNGALKNVTSDVDEMAKASGKRLQGFTGDVISVSKAMDQDLGGVTRAVGQMLRTGLAGDAQEALDIITVGFQNGADKSEDFLDTINEYGTQFRKLGIDGETATGLIAQGLKAGARDGDLVADSLKEFSIRALDGSETTKEGFKKLGLDADKMAERIGKGGESASKGLDMTLDRLRKIKDPVERSQAAIQLFGTQAEDLGDALFALDPSKATDGLGKVAGAARKANEELGDTPRAKIDEFWRTLKSGGEGALSSITPKLGDAAGAATGFIREFREGKGVGGEFSSAISGSVDRVKGAVSNWVSKNRDDIDSVVNAFKSVGQFAKSVFEDTVAPIIRRTFSKIGDWFDGLWHVIRGIVRGVAGLFSGDWDKAWSGAKEAVGGAFKAIKTLLEISIGNLWEVIKDIGPKIIGLIGRGLKGLGKSLVTGLWEGIKAAASGVWDLAGKVVRGIGTEIKERLTGGLGGLGKGLAKAIGDGLEYAVKNLPEAAWNGLKSLGGSIVDKLVPGGDGIGKRIGDGVGSRIAAFGGGLDGARPIMAPIAGMAARFGLGVSSGLRSGAITSSGNVSYHSTGEALDITGNPDGMLAFFRYMKNALGGRLAELIYTPGGVGIRNGAPHRYSGGVAADHFDHVHVAIDSGTPGVGDGEGRKVGKRSSSDEMGWLNQQWEKVAPAFGLDAQAAPLGSLFKHMKLTGRSSFVGVTYDPKAKGHEGDELLWPSWLWRDSKGQKALDEKSKLKLFVHEMAHRFQDRKATAAGWKSEGGAEAFARLSMDRFFGGYRREKGDPYSGYTTKVMRELGTGWVVSGQFGKATGDGIGKSDRDLIESAAASGGISPDILYGVWGAESRFSHGPGPVSRAGARGPFQFMPGTAKEMGVNPGNLRSSAFGAAKYLGRYKGRGVAGMLAAYNAGPAGNPNNAETKAYVPRVLSFARQWSSGGGSGGSSSGGGGKPKSGVSSGGPVGGGGNAGVVTRAQALYNPQDDGLSDEQQRAYEYATKTGRFAPPRPLKGGGPTKGFTPGEVEQGIPEQIRDRMFPEDRPTELDYLDAALAMAEADQITDQRDVDALQAVGDYRFRDYHAALASGDPRRIAQTRRDLTSAEQAIIAATKALEDNTRAQQDRDALNQEIVANQRKILALAQQGDAILAAVVAAVSGGIGQTVGQAMGTPSFAGGVANYGRVGRL